MNNLKINHLAVLVCIVVMHVLGFLWYGPLFGEKWMALCNLDMTKAQQGSGEAALWILNFLASAIPVYFLAWLYVKLDVTTGIRGAILGFLITFCFFHLPEMSGNMFAQIPYAMAWITGGYRMVAFTICGFILGAWTKKIA
jgi:hypothetical protein